jgi:hypothetical protein
MDDSEPRSSWAAALMLCVVGIVGVTMVLAVRLRSVVLAAPIALVVFVLMMVLKHRSGEHALGRAALWLFSMALALVLMVPAVVWIGLGMVILHDAPPGVVEASTPPLR